MCYSQLEGVLGIKVGITYMASSQTSDHQTLLIVLKIVSVQISQATKICNIPLSLAVDTLSLVWANYNVGESGTILKDEHGIRLASLRLSSTNSGYMSLDPCIHFKGRHLRLRSYIFMPPSKLPVTAIALLVATITGQLCHKRMQNATHQRPRTWARSW